MYVRHIAKLSLNIDFLTWKLGGALWNMHHELLHGSESFNYVMVQLEEFQPTTMDHAKRKVMFDRIFIK